ncbi:MAG TPA: DNA-3-methyladenine glycosylase 2 family protein, partial [Flavisolibacter sp.]|nr:DNA-3-methyladenine glycosylase 2 family protein [Flavisolibacter sp.]
LIKKDKDLKSIFDQYGYPPFWTRPNSFATLVLTILEQQVSLLSAYAAYTRLKEKLEPITPESLLALTDEDLRSCYFSRQKIVYTRGLARALISNEINLERMESLPDETVRARLIKLKGIGNWTVDIYLIHALRRTDIFPTGDLALVNAVRMIKEDKNLTKEAIVQLSLPWKPYRSVATMMFWHYYIKKRNIRLLH